MYEITEPLRVLLKEDAEWPWGPSQQTALIQMKKQLTNVPLLQDLNNTKETTFQVDSSQASLRAVLLQDNHPIAYASRALTETEQNWLQIDQELLAIVYGFERFHSYVYGRRIDVQTDHHILDIIIQKYLRRASLRLQRLLLRLMKYKIKK